MTADPITYAVELEAVADWLAEPGLHLAADMLRIEARRAREALSDD